ncbi:hypothetical protein KFL_002430070 [Klebsormidium nitens]|uniref:Uncharacterized protein n=1 Tax=Klebsormidium nitens TaxID=105231 RepID=A0A1Y1I8X6_KLENI|nr:hypothetical protein KFL_002430070 [Klebsormidium nitens]|eukprot:GAQ85591.1 hypothetical protein KFL_002430070 [Klebsormidium nitens]
MTSGSASSTSSTESKILFPKGLYESVFCDVVCPAFLPILRTVRKGKLILDEDLRCKVLSLWVYKEQGSSRRAAAEDEDDEEDDDGYDDEHDEEDDDDDDDDDGDAYDLVEAEFLEILSTLPKDRQRAVLDPWMGMLLQPKNGSGEEQDWEPWFEDWVQAFFIHPSKDETDDQHQSEKFDLAQPASTTPLRGGGVQMVQALLDSTKSSMKGIFDRVDGALSGHMAGNDQDGQYHRIP